MIILTSNGLSSETLLEKVSKSMIDCSKAVIITTASVGYKEKDWHIPKLTSELKQLTLSVDLFDFDQDNPMELLKYDVVEINGGNPFYLLNSMNASHCKEILQEIAEEKVLIGVSAGSMVLQKNIELIAQYSPELNAEVQLTDFSGLGITDLQILPHYNRFIQRFDCFEERARQFEIAKNCTILRINDGQGVFVSTALFETV